ncbi:signal peptidase I [Motilibacter rhizosphaerae]|uniref:Signal peptidase I n=1 Tax=Motilibacter rhizosphaerae TaxID=598652 RepID=A0A4Q7NR95_9ACTN|nr:signal peptidase I [Motilibacter rhizosphaerae]RZS87150.1 signal peptidase I [Motilibacter rhizosphaerae]
MPAASPDRSLLLRGAVVAVLGVAAAAGSRTWLVQAFSIPSESMERTLHGCAGCSGNDRVLVEKVTRRVSGVRRGEVVVFRTTGTAYAALGERDVVKRVVGLPGDTVACCDVQGRVTVDGRGLAEPYVYEDDHRRFGPVVVPAGQMWVMGDHRSDSRDSRSVGPVPEGNVVGRAVLRFWPPSRAGLL